MSLTLLIGLAVVMRVCAAPSDVWPTTFDQISLPAEDDIWKSGDNYDIEWKYSQYYPESVTISYLFGYKPTDMYVAGSIVNGTYNDIGRYAWNVPIELGVEERLYRIQIVYDNDTVLVSTSDIFKIYPPDSPHWTSTSTGTGGTGVIVPPPIPGLQTTTTDAFIGVSQQATQTTSGTNAAVEIPHSTGTNGIVPTPTVNTDPTPTQALGKAGGDSSQTQSLATQANPPSQPTGGQGSSTSGSGGEQGKGGPTPSPGSGSSSAGQANPPTGAALFVMTTTSNGVVMTMTETAPTTTGGKGAPTGPASQVGGSGGGGGAEGSGGTTSGVYSTVLPLPGGGETTLFGTTGTPGGTYTTVITGSGGNYTTVLTLGGPSPTGGPSSSGDGQSSSSGLPGYQIAAIAVGCTGAIALLIALFVFMRMFRRKKKQEENINRILSMLSSQGMDEKGENSPRPPHQGLAEILEAGGSEPMPELRAGEHLRHEVAGRQQAAELPERTWELDGAPIAGPTLARGRNHSETTLAGSNGGGGSGRSILAGPVTASPVLLHARPAARNSPTPPERSISPLSRHDTRDIAEPGISPISPSQTFDQAFASAGKGLGGRTTPRIPQRSATQDSQMTMDERIAATWRPRPPERSRTNDSNNSSGEEGVRRGRPDAAERSTSPMDRRRRIQRSESPLEGWLSPFARVIGPNERARGRGIRPPAPREDF